MSMAKSIEDAMRLLKGEEIEAPPPTSEPPKAATTGAKKGAKVSNKEEDDEDEGADTEDEEDTEKGLQVEIVKSEQAGELEDFVKADDFMLALAQNQDVNMEILAKGLEGNLNASARMLDFFKAIDTRLERIELTIGAAPQPRRAILHKGEASALESRMVRSPKDGEVTLTRPDMVGLLVEGVRAGTCQAIDVVKAETGFGGSFSMGAIDVVEVVSSLSPGAQSIIKSFLQTKGI